MGFQTLEEDSGTMDALRSAKADGRATGAAFLGER